MRFMVIVKATPASESGVLPTTEEFATMGKYNEELARAGIIQAGEGLHPSSNALRVRFTGTEQSVEHGPFPNTEELVAGFWLWKVKSREEALEWLKRAPFTKGEVVELRQIYEAEDFGETFTPELREQEDRIRSIASQH